MLNEIEMKIFKCLFNHIDNYISSKEIAKSINVSDKTVRKYINKYKISISQHGATIFSKQGYGYKLQVNNEEKFRSFLNDKSFELGQPSLVKDSTEERQNEICKILLFEKDWITVDSLITIFYVSRATLNNDIKLLKRKLQNYNLFLISKPYYGIKIEGLELDKRHFIIDYFFSSEFYSSIYTYFGSFISKNDIKLEELTIIVLDETREGKVYLSDFLIQNLVIHLALSIKRIRDGHIMKERLVIEPSISEEIRRIAKKIIHRIQNAYDINFPENEEEYIALHILSKGIHENQILENNKVTYEIENAIKSVAEYFNVDITNDSVLSKGIESHLAPLKIRLQNNISINNPLLKEILGDYKIEFEVTKKYFSKITNLSYYYISDDEWAYITLHILAAIQRAEERKKINALVICATGYGSAQMLSIRIKKKFGNSINVKGVIGYYDINNQELNDIDIIISSIDLSALVFQVPAIKVSVLLNETDIQNIQNELNVILRKQKNNSPKSKEQINESEIDEIIGESLFVYEESNLDKDSVELLLANKITNNEKELTIALLENMKIRESLSTVIFSKYVAVPHPLNAISETSKIAVAILPNGVYWNKDNNDIKIIFLLSPSKHEGNNMKRLVRYIVEIIENEDLVKELIKCRNYEQFKYLLMQTIRLED